MGWADMLIMLGIPYNSEEAIFLARDLMNFINGIALDESKRLAKTRGVYPALVEIMETVHESQRAHIPVVRNATRTTIAPTGTISIVADCSSGVEPLFAIAFMRDQADMKMMDVNPMFKKALASHGIPLSIALVEKIMKAGTIAHMDEIPEEIRKVWVTAHDISPEWHVKMQAAFQAHTDNAVSKTINLPHSATIEDVKDIYMLAYKTGCKGTTMYRDGSRDSQVLTTGATFTKDEPKTDEQPATLQVKPRIRPDTTTGFTEKVQIGCGKLYVTVNYDDQGLCEVFTNTGRAGGCPSQSEAVSRLVSLGLRSGIDASAIIDQLKGIRCPSTTGKGLKCTSCPDAIGRLLEKVVKQMKPKDIVYDKIEVTTFNDPEPVFIDGEGHCPECGKVVEHEGGCMVCRNCGFSKCG
jgi:ribonucleoside-diphosphate reductase alpha chain